MAKDPALTKGNTVVRHEMPNKRKMSKNREWDKMHAKQRHEKLVADEIEWTNTQGGADALESE